MLYSTHSIAIALTLTTATAYLRKIKPVHYGCEAGSWAPILAEELLANDYCLGEEEAFSSGGAATGHW